MRRRPPESRRDRLGTYLELHIEQGPVLEKRRRSPAAAVAGTFGVERFRAIFSGQASHAGTTPMDRRRDAFLATAEAALVVERLARERGGVGTVGQLVLESGIPTAVAGEAAARRGPPPRASRARSPELEAAAGAAFRAAAEGRGCSATIEAVWNIEPIPFYTELVELAERRAPSSRKAAATPERRAARCRRARRGASLGDDLRALDRRISHAPEEDTPEEDLTRAIAAFGDLAARVLTR